MARTCYAYADKIWAPVHIFTYTGESQEFTLQPGEYLFVCKGAPGGGIEETYNWGYGASAYGVLTLEESQTLYAYVGGPGEVPPSTSISGGLGGWNGGGNGADSLDNCPPGGFGGGGASDIRLIEDDGTNTSESLLSRIIVAAGGGGGCKKMGEPSSSLMTTGGGGNIGGFVSETANTNDPDFRLHYATQTDGYAFGIGQSAAKKTTGYSYGSEGSGGGGGGWYGGYANTAQGEFTTYHGVGGSSYVLTESSYKPSGYTPDSTFYMSNANTQPCQNQTPSVEIYIKNQFIKNNDTIIIPFTGKSTKLSLQLGEYILKCWGAEGGLRPTRSYDVNSYRSYGGYAQGTLNLKYSTDLYAYVGGSGLFFNQIANLQKQYNPGCGFNGGGTVSGQSSTALQNEPGGGASDIRLIEDDGTNTSESLLSRIIVAGGGGGEGKPTSRGGYGGGTSGGYPDTTKWGTNTGGGTQTGSGHSQDHPEIDGGFGYGGKGIYIFNGFGGAGGGGWYGGSGTYPDGSGDDDMSGSGGSGYVLTESSYKPEGYSPTEDFYLSDTILRTGEVTNVNSSKAEIFVTAVSNAYILIHDSEGYKKYNKEISSWEYFSDTITPEDFIDYGTRNVLNLNGVADEFDVCVYDISDQTNKINILNAPKTQSISFQIPTTFNVINQNIDSDYDPNEFTFSTKITPQDDTYKLYNVYVEKLTGNDSTFKLFNIQLFNQ